MIDRVLPATATAATLVGAGFVVISQAVFNPFADTVERVVGGSVLLAAAWLIVRWTFRLMDKVGEIAEADRDAWLNREKMLLDQLANTNSLLAEVNAQLSSERQLRMSLEKSGLAERRSREE